MLHTPPHLGPYGGVEMNSFKRLSITAKACSLMLRSVLLIDRLPRAGDNGALDSVVANLKNLIETLETHIDVVIAHGRPRRK